MRSKDSVKPGDMIHIYHMFGSTPYTNKNGEIEFVEDSYSGREGIVRVIDDMNQIHGSWGGLALFFDDDWEIIEEE